MIRVTVDRFEGDYAIVELPDKNVISVPKMLFAGVAKEGDIIRIEVDKDEMQRRKTDIEILAREVIKK